MKFFNQIKLLLKEKGINVLKKEDIGSFRFNFKNRFFNHPAYKLTEDKEHIYVIMFTHKPYGKTINECKAIQLKDFIVKDYINLYSHIYTCVIQVKKEDIGTIFIPTYFKENKDIYLYEGNDKEPIKEGHSLLNGNIRESQDLFLAIIMNEGKISIVDHKFNLQKIEFIKNEDNELIIISFKNTMNNYFNGDYSFNE